MKKAEWAREFWAKALSFVLAVLFVPFAAVCAASLLAAYEFEWWTGGNYEYQQFLDWAQGKYWTLRGMSALYDLHFAAVPLLVAAVLLFLFFVIYLACVAGRQPGTDEVRAGWQEKIPFDLYLAIVALAAIALVFIGDESTYWFQDEPLGYVLILLGIAVLLAVLLLATWMTFCTRVKLGKWWRNTVTFWLLSLCWRFVKWCWRVLCSIGRGLRGTAAAVPLVWKTLLLLIGISFIELFILLNFHRNVESLIVGWFFEKLLLFPAVLYFALELKKLQAVGAALAAGNLDAKVDTKHMYWDLRAHGENLNDISRGMQLAVDKQLKSERLKTELITNVSHDIKTPLTSIINYVGLLRRDPTEEQAKEYLEVLARQSQRLKKLTENLVEVSKASTGNVAVNASRRSVNEMLLQAVGEYSERLDRAKLDAVLTLPDREIFAWVDGTLLWRVLDNVFSNACKYALPGTRFYIDAQESAGKAKLSFKNISRDRLNVPADELMERFVRGDSSRGGEGSGLGLNIAKSLTELQGGAFDVSVDGDLFRVDIILEAMQ